MFFVGGGKNCFGMICYGVWVDEDRKLLFACAKVATLTVQHSHIFSRLLTRVSSMNKVCRVVAPICQAIKQGSYKVQSPTVWDEIISWPIFIKHGHIVGTFVVKFIDNISLSPCHNSLNLWCNGARQSLPRKTGTGKYKIFICGGAETE